jgi:hypothetical protein
MIGTKRLSIASGATRGMLTQPSPLMRLVACQWLSGQCSAVEIACIAFSESAVASMQAAGSSSPALKWATHWRRRLSW